MPDRLQQAITVLQTRFGSAAPRPAAPVASPDFPGRLDPEFLSHFDARLDHLLVVRPKSLREGMASVRVLARAGVDMICIDLSRTGSAGLDAELPHLLHRAAEAECTLLLVHDADADDAIRYYASLI